MHANFTRGTCPILNITNDNGSITWEHKAMVSGMKTEPGEHNRSWDINLGTGETTHVTHHVQTHVGNILRSKANLPNLTKNTSMITTQMGRMTVS